MSGALEIDSTFAGRYHVRRQLGRGAMGAVYLVEDRVLQERVALKVLSSALAGDEAIERFRREVRLARRVTHRNVVRTHDVGVAGGRHYLTMEWIDGEGLDQLLARSGPLGSQRTLEIALQLLDGLAAAHEAGVIHRDLKPSNVLLASGDRVVITDFGIAHSAIADVGEALTHGVIGTPHYMAPEQLEGGSVDARTDLYALGGVLFEMLAGELPFTAPTPLALALARLQEHPRRIDDLAEVDAALAELVMHCLARAPDERPPSAAALRERLVAAAPTYAGALVATVAPAGGAGTTGSTGTTGSSLGPLVAPMPSGRALAVLPFRYQGPAEDSYLADGLSEDLIDVLTRTRGLRVFGSGASSRFREQRDPTLIAAELGADLVVDATVRRAGPQVRISARLLEAQSGVQIWSQPFSGRFEDIFALQETMSRRVAEALRVEISLRPVGQVAPAQATELYLRARRQMSHHHAMRESQQIYDTLERCLELAPTMGHARALHARVCIKAWFTSYGGVPDSVWEQRARDSLALALECAGDLAETQLSAAMLATQEGDFGRAVSHLVAGLQIAPTYADLLLYLGGLQCEAGRAKEGIRRIEAGIELDPHQVLALISVARIHALRGDDERYRAAMARIRETPSRDEVAFTGLQARVLLWRGDKERGLEILGKMPRQSGAGLLFQAFHAAISGAITPEQLRDGLMRLGQGRSNPRTRTFALQMVAEVFSALDRPDLAFDALTTAAEHTLIDVTWLELCPLLDPLRRMEGFDEVVRRTRERAAALWIDHVV